MLQYDRVVGLFGISDGGRSKLSFDDCAKLNEALLQVRSWLDLKRSTGRYAHGFLAEMAIKSTSRSFHSHAIYDEIGKLEGLDSVPSRTKRPRPMRPPLRGLWHKHYFQASFMPRNLRDETERMARDGRWEAIFAPDYGKRLDEVVNQISHAIVIGSFAQRTRDQRVTGEFIVYERQPDGSNYYLTVARHGEWDAIRARVDDYKNFDLGQ